MSMDTVGLSVIRDVPVQGKGDFHTPLSLRFYPQIERFALHHLGAVLIQSITQPAEFEVYVLSSSERFPLLETKLGLAVRLKGSGR